MRTPIATVNPVPFRAGTGICCGITAFTVALPGRGLARRSETLGRIWSELTIEQIHGAVELWRARHDLADRQDEG